MDGHISDETLEAYSLDTLPEASVPAVEEHLKVCGECPAWLDAIEPVNYVHYTDQGPVCSRATLLTSGKVMARHWGKDLEGGLLCESVSAARKYLRESFSQMFPEHRCTARCGPARGTRLAGG